MTFPTDGDEDVRQPLGLSRAEYEVLLRASRPPVHRSPDALRDMFAALASLPALKPEDGSLDKITDNDRSAASRAPSQPLAQVLETRRSHTDGLRPLSRLELVTVLARSFRVIEAGVDENGGAWSFRPVPSGGATHPFDLLVTATGVNGLTPGHYVYGPNAVSLRSLSAEQSGYADVLSAAMMSASRRREPAPASICLVANVERTAQRYIAALALLLRDAGALLATMHLVATDLDLRSCIVGSAGHFEHLVTPSLGNGSRPSLTVVDCGGLVLAGT